jgi:PPE-repeat protein
MSFMMFPPEINSALMYVGAGSGPLMAASSAWDELAADLEATAIAYKAVIAQLTGGPWLGPTSMRMASATAPYIAWLHGSAAQAAQTGGQAKLAAAAYESAFDATVPPAVIAANRALLMVLIATNFLGQNTPAIAATEAHYLEMWIQDGLAMDAYAVASEQATALPQQTPAPQTSDGGTSANTAAAAQSAATNASTLSTDLTQLIAQLNSMLPTGTDPILTPPAFTPTDLWSWLTSTTANSAGHSSGLAALPSAATGATGSTGGSGGSTLLGALAGDILPVQITYYGTMMASMPAKMLISMGNSMTASQAVQASNQAMLGTVAQLVDSKMQGMMGGIAGEMRAWGSSVSAQLASAHRLGGLSIPNGWSTAAPEMSRAAPVLPETSVSPPTASAGLPNSPFTQALMGALNGRGVGNQAAKTAPVKVETRSPAGG